MRCVFEQPHPVVLAPVVLEEQVLAGQLDEFEQPLVVGPSAMRRIQRHPHAQRPVVGHSVFGGGARLGEDPGVILRGQPVGVVRRQLVEADRHVNRLRVADHLQRLDAVDEDLTLPGVAGRLEDVLVGQGGPQPPPGGGFQRDPPRCPPAVPVGHRGDHARAEVSGAGTMRLAADAPVVSKACSAIWAP